MPHGSSVIIVSDTENLYSTLSSAWNVKSVIIVFNFFREVTRQLVLRAERAGYKALALTVDTPLFGIRRADIRNKFTLPTHLR